MRKVLISAGVAIAALAVQATTAFACGGLVAPDGDVRLEKATTFVAWHDGIEHYVTSFAYRGQSVDLGWVVPLPAVPSAIGPAGRWTLQRLEQEVQPPQRFELAAGASASIPDAAVIQHVQVEALDVTILKGSGKSVIDWCAHNGFALNDETRDHLLHYAEGSPIFMAAKYNTSSAQQQGLAQGDGVPLQMTMKTPRLWVPLEVLANDDTEVNADLFLLTDSPLSTADNPFPWSSLPGLGSSSVGASGFVIAKQQPMNDALHSDLSRDRAMSWVPSSGWLTYLTLNAPSTTVTYDLSVGSDNVIRLSLFGGKLQADAGSPSIPQPSLVLELLSAATLLPLLVAATMIEVRRYHTRKTSTSRA